MNFIQELAPYQGLIYTVANLFLCWVIWSADRRYVKKEDFSKLEREVLTLKLQFDNLPNTEELQRLALLLNTFSGDLKGITAATERLQRQVDRVEDYLSRRQAG